MMLADHVGIRAVEVEAIDETARRFYERFGFIPHLDNPDHLVLSMHLIRKPNLSPLA